MVAKDRLFRRLTRGWKSTNRHGKRHMGFTIFWVLMTPVSYITGWIYSVAFVSFLSLWALVVSHWGAYEAAIPDEEMNDGT